MTHPTDDPLTDPGYEPPTPLAVNAASAGNQLGRQSGVLDVSWGSLG